MAKKIIIHPCKNQDEMLDIARNYISDNPNVQCKSNGYHGMVVISKGNYQIVGSVQESNGSLISYHRSAESASKDYRLRCEA